MKKYILFRMAFVAFFAALTTGSFAQTKTHQKIDIKDFHVMKDQNKIDINWSIGEKVPANYFEVERSSDGKNFKTVAYVLGADPTKTDCECYGYFEKINTHFKQSYYRLKHVDMNGEVQFSKVEMLALK